MNSELLMNGRNVLVTGGHGFIGKHLVERLVSDGAHVVCPSHAQCDMTNRFELDGMMQSCRNKGILFDYCFHLAARVGGIGANVSQPAQFFRDNILMGMNIIDACLNFRVGKLVFFGTTCSYPATNEVPFHESDLFTGYPETTNAPYGVAKLALLTALQAYHKQYGFKSAYLVPSNTYGPGDNFDDNTSHVIPALIKKFNAASLGLADNIVVWGDGTPTRDLIYVDDVVSAAVLVAIKVDYPDPMNIGTGVEISINDIASMLQEIFSTDLPVVYDTSKPNGQMRRRLDINLASNVLDWKPKIDLRDGLLRTVKWWKSNR